MDKKTLVVAVVVSLAVSLLVTALRSAPPVSTVERVVRQVVGAQPGPDSTNPYFSVNGVAIYEQKYSSFPTGTTTLCSFRAPISASSTLLFAQAHITTGSTTALTFEWGKNNTTFDATTTSLGLAKLGGSGGTNATGIIQASTTASALVSTGLNPGGVDDRTVFAPGAYLNFKYGNADCTAGGTCSSLKGVCAAAFIEL